MANLENNKLTYHKGFFLPIGGRFVGGVFIFFAIAILFKPEVNIWIIALSIFILAIGLLFFSLKRLVIDKDKNRIEDQTIWLGIRSLSFKKLNDFSYITILNQQYTLNSSSKYRADISSQFSLFDVVLINQPHHLKQKIESFSTYEEALAEAKKLSSFLGYEIVKYDPVRIKRIRP